MFDIVSIGRSDFLLLVLNGLAMVTAENGPAGFGALMALGLLIGTLLGLARSVITQRLELQWVLAGWLLFEVLFYPKVTVSVEDIYTGETNTVAHVPLGPAAIGSVLSSIGTALADAFGTAFAFPSMTQAGYMDALQVVNAMRNMDYRAANSGQVGAAVAGVDVQRSLRAYLMDCVYVDLTMDIPVHSVTRSELDSATDLLAAIEVNANTWFSTMYLVAGDQDGQTLTCTEAYRQLAAFMRGRFLDAWQTYIAGQLGLENTSATMQASIDTLFGQGRTAQVYMLNSLLKRELELAEVGFHAQANNEAGVVMRVQAMEQRRTQWAAEQSLWGEMARPAIAFLEGLFYAISPFCAFLFTLGAPGMMLFARYLLLAAWIQSWMPVLAIVNLYVSVSASHDLQRLNASGTDLLTMAGLDSIWTETSSWIAFGGMMVGATPLLTLMILSGSYFAYTRMTDRMAGADHIDEKLAAPDLMASAPVATVGALGAQGPWVSRDSTHGLHLTGINSVLPSINLASDINSSVRSTQRAEQSASEEWTKSLRAGLDVSHEQGRETFLANLNSTGLTGSASRSDGVIQRMARNAVDDDSRFLQMGTDERNALYASIGLKLAKVVGFDSGLQNIKSLSEGERKAISDRIESMSSTSSDEMAELAESVKHDSSTGMRSRFFEAIGVTDATQWARAYRDSRAASDAHERASGLQSSVGLMQRLEPTVIGQKAAAEGWVGELLELASRHGLNRSDIEDQAGRWSRDGWMQHDPALATLAALGLASDSHEARLSLASSLAAHDFSSPSMSLKDSSTESTVNAAPSFGAIREEVDRQTSSAGGIDPQDHTARVSASLRDGADIAADGRDGAKAFYESRRRPESAELEPIAEFARKAEVGHYEAVASEARGLMRAIREFDLGGQLGSLDIDKRAWNEAGQAYSKARTEAMDSTGNALAATLAGLSAVGNGWAKGFKEGVAAHREAARQKALEAGLPEVAALWYAEESVVLKEDVGITVQRALGRDASYEALKEQAQEVLGSSAYTLVQQAATANPKERAEYLRRASMIYRERQQAGAATDE